MVMSDDGDDDNNNNAKDSDEDDDNDDDTIMTKMTHGNYSESDVYLAVRSRA